MEQEKKTVINLEYTRASSFKRISANLFDFTISIVLGFILLMGTFNIISNNSGFKSIVNTRETILISSELYIKKDSNVNSLKKDLEEDNDLKINEKSYKLNMVLDSFYSNSDFFLEDQGDLIYLKLKNEAKDDKQNLLFDSNLERIYQESDYDEIYLNFYYAAFDSATNYLFQNKEYRDSNNLIIIIVTFSTIGTFLIPFLIFYYLVPLFFTRTHQTFGKLICKIGIIGANGLSITFSRFTLRFLFFYIFELIISIFAFLIPFILSFSMAMISKTHQSLHDYLFTTYVVDVDKKKIYKSLQEYKDSPKKSINLKIEDKSYEPKF